MKKKITKKWIKENTKSLRAAASILKIKTEILQYQVDRGRLDLFEGRIKNEDVERIQRQREAYLNLREYMVMQENERFIAKNGVHRNKFIDFLEENDYFEIKKYPCKDMLFVSEDESYFFVDQEGRDILDKNSAQFFKEFGFTEKENVERCIAESKSRNKALLRDFIFRENRENTSNIYTPLFREFVKNILMAKSYDEIDEDEIDEQLIEAKYEGQKKYIIKFWNYVRGRGIKVKYGILSLQEKESKEIMAYPYEKYVILAKFLFSPEFCKQQKLIEKAFSYSMFAEMWLFLSLFYVCGWRGEDICDCWVYPNLEANNVFGINIDTIKEDVVFGKIDKSVCIDVADYCLKKTEYEYNLPGKTGERAKGTLRAYITADLKEHFGILLIIAEYHHKKDEDRGYMKKGRMNSYYCNWTVCEEFFGKEFREFRNKTNIETRRMNKSYLQGIQKVAEDIGTTMLEGYMVASFARNHANPDTTLIYLKDHGLSGMHADFVLNQMLRRGIMGMHLYRTLIQAYPESFEKLTEEAKTEVIEKMNISSLQLEAIAQIEIPKMVLQSSFANYDMESTRAILKEMFIIGQRRGVGKEKGIYCRRRAMGYTCENPAYESCLAEVCPHLVFTFDGVSSLIKVLRKYKEKEESGNPKYKNVLKDYIVPAYKDILEEIMRQCSKSEKEVLKTLIDLPKDMGIVS